MSSTWDGDTRELGGGSYPEPPDLPEYDNPECEECGCYDSVKEVDGKNLCWACRCKEYLETADEAKIWEYIQHDEDTRLKFFRDFWFKSLSDTEQFLILRMGFTDSYMWSEKYPPYKEKKKEKLELLKDFCQANLDDFSSFVEGIA